LLVLREPTPVRADYHVHTNYSDGHFLNWMVEAAADAGLDAVGLADHCNVSPRPEMRAHKLRYGHNLDATHERRREAIEAIREEVDVAVYDAAEVDYHPDDEAEIEAFLADTPFDYAVGSVHEVDGINVHDVAPFEGRSEAERRAAVDGYFEDLEQLIRSELFEIAAHPDIVERNAALRGLADRSHYEQVAAAFADSRTIPEINAGRVTADYGRFHPRGEFLDALAEYDVPITVGSDAHAPDQLRERAPLLRERLDERGIEPASPLDR
jgi:histidinol-phosphatase (PHP family)